jgi:hypothetical protein
MDMVSELLYWCSYGKCYIREQKDARPRVDAVTATTSNKYGGRLLQNKQQKVSLGGRSARLKASRRTKAQGDHGLVRDARVT